MMAHRFGLYMGTEIGQLKALKTEVLNAFEGATDYPAERTTDYPTERTTEWTQKKNIKN